MKENDTKFIACPKYKNLPKKHVAVCRSCKWNMRCRAYQEYWQPVLPFAIKKR